MLPDKKTITVFFLLLCITCKAQYVFTGLQKQDGLSGNNVICSYKDNDGFMWFGTTAGLNRFDGAGFKHYNRLDKKASVIADDIITSICGNGKNLMWVGAKSGLFLFDKQLDSFTHIVAVNEKNIQAPLLNIEKLLPDNQQRLWVKTQQGLFVVKDNKVLPVAQVYPSAAVLNNVILYVAATATDSLHNGIWLASAEGLFFIDFKNGQTYSAKNNPAKNILFNAEKIFSLALSTNGNLWVSSSSHPLGHYSFSNNAITDTKIGEVKGFNRMFADSKNRLWLSNFTGKIFVLNAEGKLNILPHDSPESYKLSNVLFADVYEDNEKNLWIAGPNGVNKLSAGNYLQNIIKLPGNLFNTQFADAVINSICSADSSSLWICKNDGLYLLNKETGVFKRYAVSATEENANRFFDIQFIKGQWWCATGDGIKILDPANNQFSAFKYYAAGYEIKNRSASWVLQDKLGNTWFAAWTDAVYRFNPVTKQTLRVNELSDRPAGKPPGTNSLCAFENTDGKLWISNGENGIGIYDHSTGLFTFPRNLNNVIINNICKAGKQDLWLATTGRGILKADANGVLTDSITINNGLSISTIWEIATDRWGRIWVCSSEGIQYINPVTKTVSKLNIDMGLPVHEVNGAMLLYEDKLYGAAINKIVTVDLPAVARAASAAAPLISGISVFNNKIPFSSANPVLHLKYDENFFQIEFSSLNHKEITSLQYAYMLKGFDKDWVYCGRRQTAAYTNVPNGNYTFLVKCTDANGQWTTKETVITIFIQPPFWKTAWFITLIALLAVATFWWMYKSRQKKLQQARIEKAIDYFANSVYGENSVNEICWDIARNCNTQLQFKNCVVYLLNEKSNQLVQQAAYGDKNPKVHDDTDAVEIATGKGVVAAAAASGKPILINDTSKNKNNIADDAQYAFAMAVPILYNSKVIGVIGLEHAEKDFFTPAHLKAVNTIASISASKIAEAMAAAQAKQKEIQLLEINKMLAESQLMALRAQMNPHFVFNCLNSIQECIVTEKYGEASKYLNKFSKLFRIVLNNSGKKLVSIDEEKEVLELYLELEQMRFEKSFTYSITIDDGLDTEEILLPSMLLQPYVENALWHGLMHKEGERKLLITFERINEDIFRCTIDDNGIGRKNSFALKAQQSKTKRHESKGLKISEDRINVLKRQGYAASLQITDKYDAQQNATGTKVVIELSTFLKS